MKNKWVLPATCVFGALLLSPGCGKPPTTGSANCEQLFASTQWQIDWTIISAATKTNGYLVAITALKRMESAKLDPQQSAAINATLLKVNDLLLTAGSRGDPAAQTALNQLQETAAREQGR